MVINSGATLDIVGAVPLKGSGSLTISNNSALMGYAQAAGASLTSQIPIQGAGSITPSSGSSFTNQATVNANQTNPLTINSGNGTVTNTGTLEATNRTTLARVDGTVSNTRIIGYAQSTGASLHSQSTIQGTDGISAQNGNTITNQGTIYSNETNPLTIGMGKGGTFANMGMGTLKVKKGSAMYVPGGGFNNLSGSHLTGGK